jgi:hypothetical protein
MFSIEWLIIEEKTFLVVGENKSIKAYKVKEEAGNFKFTNSVSSLNTTIENLDA